MTVVHLFLLYLYVENEYGNSLNAAQHCTRVSVDRIYTCCQLRIVKKVVVFLLSQPKCPFDKIQNYAFTHSGVLAAG